MIERNELLALRLKACVLNAERNRTGFRQYRRAGKTILRQVGCRRRGKHHVGDKRRRDRLPHENEQNCRDHRANRNEPAMIGRQAVNLPPRAAFRRAYENRCARATAYPADKTETKDKE